MRLAKLIKVLFRGESSEVDQLDADTFEYDSLLEDNAEQEAESLGPFQR